MLSIVFTFYRTLDLTHLERALYSVSRQEGLCELADELVFVDNNTVYEPGEIRSVVELYFQEPFVSYHFMKHGDSTRRHSWSANYGIRAARNERVFFTRADYILMEDCLYKMAAQAEGLSFVSGWCWQMGYDRQAESTETPPPYEAYGWRTNVRYLLQYPYAFEFPETDQDAGVYVTSREAMEKGGWYDEAMINFGYQQSTLQRKMRKAGVKMWAIPEFLFCHQHHEADRDFDRARKEYNQSRGG